MWSSQVAARPGSAVTVVLAGLRGCGGGCARRGDTGGGVMVGTSGGCSMLNSASFVCAGGVLAGGVVLADDGVLALQKSLSQNEPPAGFGAGLAVLGGVANAGVKSLSKNDVHPATAAGAAGSGACTAAGRVGGGESVALPPLARRGCVPVPGAGDWPCGVWLAAKAAKKSSSWRFGVAAGAGVGACAAGMSKKDGDCGVAVGCGGVCTGVCAWAVGAGAGAGVLLSSTHASIEKKSPLPAAAGVAPRGAAVGAALLCAVAAVAVTAAAVVVLRGALGEPDTSAAWLYGTKFCPQGGEKGEEELSKVCVCAEAEMGGECKRARGWAC